MTTPFHGDPFAIAAAATTRLNDLNCVQQQRKAWNALDALTAAILDGLRDAWSAHPDVFSPYVFDVNEAAAFLATWIAARPR